jgi:CRP/FNR family transcriptional regulator, anaerobic regulatory protein
LTESHSNDCPRCAERSKGAAPFPADPEAHPETPCDAAARPSGRRPGGFGAGALDALGEAARRTVPAGRVLEVAGDPARAVYHVLEGWLVASRSTEAGQRQIVDFVLPGQVFDPASASPRRCSVDLAAQSAARVAVVARGEWTRLLRADAALRDLRDRHLACAFVRLAERMLRLGKGSAETRIAYAVCELGLRAAAPAAGLPHAFHLPLTQQALGDYVGLSSVHVSRTFQRFRRLGVLSVDNCMDIVLHDAEGLARIAEIDAATLGEAVLAGP